MASKNINVNAIAPGYMETDNTMALRSDPVRSRQILERIPAGRWGEPKDIAGAALFLCSPRATMCTARPRSGWGLAGTMRSNVSLTIKAKDACRWDLVSLGEVMLRFDPGDYRI